MVRRYARLDGWSLVMAVSSHGMSDGHDQIREVWTLTRLDTKRAGSVSIERTLGNALLRGESDWQQFTGGNERLTWLRDSTSGHWTGYRDFSDRPEPVYEIRCEPVGEDPASG